MSSVPSEPRRLPEHGTVARYNAGCGCRPCKRARADYSTERYQAKRRAQREAQLAQRELVLDAVQEYRRAGWTPFPLPAASKFPPPRGITGASARPVTDADYERWEGEWGNVGLLMSDGIVGLDLDLYKAGDAVADGLPPTIRSTSRGDGSGIYLYRVPPDTKLKGTIEGLGEVVQRTHRYAVAWPSLHPEGRQYRWLNDYDEPVGVPSIDDLPSLPETWLKRLSEPQRPRRQNKGKGFSGDIDDWMDSLPDGPMSRAVREALKRSMGELCRYRVTGTGRYDVMVKGIGRLVALGAARHRGVGQALDSLIDEYVMLIDGEPDRNPYTELDRAISGAVRKFGGSQ